MLERFGQQLGTDFTVLGELLDEPAQQLGQDDARVAPRPHQGSVGNSPADQLHGGVDVEGIELGDDRLNRQGHVRAGVAVGHGIDIEAVDDLLVRAQKLAKRAYCGSQLAGGQRRRRGH